MTIKLYKYNGDSRKVKKTLDSVQTISNATVITSMNIIDPVIILDMDMNFNAISSFNYVYITELKRYYFVKNIEILENGFLKIY